MLLAWSAATTAAQPITDNDFRIDAQTTPVLGGGRIVGLGGAYTALAEGIDSVPYNPAGYAARAAHEHEWYEWELSGSLQLAGAFTDVDYFLNGQGTGIGEVSGFYGYGVSGRLQFAQLGVGGSLQVESFDLRPDDPIEVSFTTVRFGGGYNLLEGQLAIGVGGQYVSMTVRDGLTPLVDFSGIGLEAGAVLRLANRRWRAGLMARSPVDARVLDEAGDPTAPPMEAGGFLLPRSVNLPWEIRAGFAWQFLERQFNPRFAPPKDVEDAVEARLEERWCERERAQAVRELDNAMSEDTVGECPRLRRQPRDRTWWVQERTRRQEERELAQDEIDRGQAEVGELWDSIEASRERRYLLVSADLRLLGPVGKDGVGVDGFIAQQQVRRGDGIDVGVHVGAEAEPWRDRMKVRCGVYWEPSRYADFPVRVGNLKGRFHGTLGFEFKVIELWGWGLRAGFYVDGARDWVNWGVSIGGWH